MSFKFERLEVWKQSIDFCDQIFTLVDELPKKYQYSLADQLRRAALSVPTNIAEGTGRDGIKEANYFYRIAKGSVYEVVSLLVIAGKRDELSRENYTKLYEQANYIAAMLTGLMKAK